MYKEASFAPDYRATEVGQIMQALYRLRSIVIYGLAGMGKSNLARFIVSHPQVQSRYLKERAGSYGFIHVDCAGLARDDEAELLDEVAARLDAAGLAIAPTESPAGSARRAVKARVMAVAADITLVLVFDYFDQIAGKLESSFFNYLASLRNARPRANLAYIFVTRRPLPQLHELQELLDDPCIVGPLCRADVLAAIGRDEVRLGVVFSAMQREALIAWSGGHPGLLKNACELLAAGQVDASLATDVACRLLLGSSKIRNLCEELWRDLSADEQETLTRIAQGSILDPAPHTGDLDELERSGVLVRIETPTGRARFRLCCPLLEIYTRDQGKATVSGVQISAVPPNRARITVAAGEMIVQLSPKLHALLVALTEARGKVVSNDELIARVYPGDEGDVSDAALAQLVKRLREALDPHVRRMTGDADYTAIETVRSIGHRLRS